MLFVCFYFEQVNSELPFMQRKDIKDILTKNSVHKDLQKEATKIEEKTEIYNAKRGK